MGFVVKKKNPEKCGSNFLFNTIEMVRTSDMYISTTICSGNEEDTVASLFIILEREKDLTGSL